MFAYERSFRFHPCFLVVNQRLFGESD